MAAQMVSMEMDDEAKLDTLTPIPMEKPDFPCGLRICLTEAEFEKLDLDPTLAQPGALFHGHFMARITFVSQTKDGDAERCRVEAQIEDLALESEDQEND